MNFNLMFLDYVFLGNSIEKYLISIIIISVGLVLKKNVSKFLSKFLFDFLIKVKNIKGEDFYLTVKKPLDFLFTLIIFSLSFRNLETDIISQKISILGDLNFNKVFSFFSIVFFIWLLLKITDFFKIIFIKKAEKTKSKLDDQLIPFFTSLVKILITILGIFTIASNIFNINITALAAGLGVGGIAIAMAAKESLENLFGSFVIFLDRPFVVGDIVTVTNVTGVIESVGFRSTRIRTFDKSLVTVPNKKMVDAEVDNLGMRSSRRTKFNLGITYETSKGQIKKITRDIKKIIDQHPNTDKNFGRVKFLNFGSSSLDIMVMYYVKGTDWDTYLDTTEEINFKIMDIVKKHKSDFAFPSTTVYLNK